MSLDSEPPRKTISSLHKTQSPLPNIHVPDPHMRTEQTPKNSSYPPRLTDWQSCKLHKDFITQFFNKKHSIEFTVHTSSYANSPEVDIRYPNIQIKMGDEGVTGFARMFDVRGCQDGNRYCIMILDFN